MNDKITFSVLIERSLRDRLRLYAVKNKKTIREIVPEILAEFLKKDK